jgi:cbb3-type cytochrome oxidase cytochrome c subunit
MTPARGSKMPYTAYDKTRTTDTGVKNAKAEVEINGVPMAVTEIPSGDEMLKAASSPDSGKKIVEKAIKAAKAYNKAEKREVKAMVEVSKALNKIIRNSKKKHRNEFIKALKKTNNFPLISELVR